MVAANDNKEFNVIVDMPEKLEVTSEAVWIVETYMRDIVAKIMAMEAANDND